MASPSLPGRMPTVLGRSLKAPLAVAEAAGFSNLPILAVAKLDSGAVEDPDARIPIDKAGRVWAEVQRLTNNQTLGLDAAQALPIGTYGVIDYLMMHGATLGSSFQRLADHFSLVAEPLRIEVTIGEERCEFRIRDWKKNPTGVPPLFAEFCLASFVVRSRWAFQWDWQPLGVYFRFPEPPKATRHRESFACPVHFGCDWDGFTVDRATWDKPLPTANAGLCAVLDAHAGELIKKLPPPDDDSLSALRSEIWRAIQHGECRVDVVARRLGMSGRSLQRRLREIDSSFASELADVRSELARLYLTERDFAIVEISSLLGFSEQSAFQRAFKRWTGSTPQEFRRGSAGSFVRSAH